METNSHEACEHKWVFLETRKDRQYGDLHSHWVRIDMFYCEKCIEFKNKKQDTYSNDKPEWY